MDSTTATTRAATEQKFVRGLGLLDSTMLVAGSMIGSGIFIVSSIIGRQVGAPGWLLVVWIVTGVLTLMAALSYGELAAMMPKAGGQYVYLREAFSPLWGFLYGWTLFLVIQTGTIAAVAVGFARYMGVLVPWVSESNYLIQPIRLGGYAISLSTAQLVGLLLIALLTFMNTLGLKLGKIVQNIFTTAKTGAHRADPPRHCGRAPIRGGRGEFFRFLEFAWRIARSWKGSHRGNWIRTVRWHLRRANELALFC